MDVVVVHYNAPVPLSECLNPLISELGPNGSLSLTIVDNDEAAPADEVRAQLERLEGGRYVARPENDGFGTGSNVGARYGSASHLLLLNPDCVIELKDIEILSRTLKEDSSLVAVGPRIERPNGIPEISWAHHPGLLWEARRRRLWLALGQEQPWAIAKAMELVSKPRTVEWLTAACLMVRRDVFEAVGGFDEDFFLYFEDADLGVRLGEHGLLRFEPKAVACHRGGASTAENETGTLTHYRASQRLYYQKHRPLWERLGLRLWRVFKP